MCAEFKMTKRTLNQKKKKKRYYYPCHHTHSLQPKSGAVSSACFSEDAHDIFRSDPEYWQDLSSAYPVAAAALASNYAESPAVQNVEGRGIRHTKTTREEEIIRGCYRGYRRIV